MIKKLTFYIFILQLFFQIPVSAQEDKGEWIDNPNYDNVPPYFYNINPEVDPEAVITIDGWDNFNLGVNTAEPHQSVNPLNPVQYFNAWNINYTYNTQDGHNWSGLAPNFGVTVRGDPVTAYDSLGNLYY